MIALECESESKEPPLQKTQRQRREKTTGCDLTVKVAAT